jgi:YD repeat-containing protein
MTGSFGVGTSGPRTVRTSNLSRQVLLRLPVLCSPVRGQLEEVEVRFLLTILSLGLAACSIAQTTPGPTAIPVVVPESRSYLVLLAEDGHTWCAYEHVAAFEAAVEKTRPTETARATFLADKLIELTHQIEAESGDWIVVDRYTPKDGGTTATGRSANWPRSRTPPATSRAGATTCRRVRDPDGGSGRRHLDYVPNAFGELAQLRDAKTASPNWTTQFTYDKLSRPLTRIEAEGTTTWTWGTRVRRRTSAGWPPSRAPAATPRATPTTASAGPRSSR